MKKIILSFNFFFACIFSIHAQTLYGLTPFGGNGGGTIIKFIPGTNNLTVAKSFDGYAANPHYTNFIQAANGKLYSMAIGGGSNDRGVIFSYDPSSSTYTILKNFDGANGAYPYSSLVQASDGKLYGMTSFGGSGNYGVIFSFDPSSSTYTKLKDFDNTNGAKPKGSLVQASNGKLYGTTVQGGSSNLGVIFSFDPSSSTYTKLKEFDGVNGAHPYCSLVQASNGKLYGMTPNGGSNDYGVIFSYDPPTSTYTMLKDFPDGTNGRVPYGNLVQASDGKLYGMTSYGGSNDIGVIFSFHPSSPTYSKLKDFDNANGAIPYGSFIQAGNGKLYGMSSAGGSSNLGVIFSFDPVSSDYIKLKSFDGGSNGRSPGGNLVQASDGKLYGMTGLGGGNDYGIIFSFDLVASMYTKLRDLEAVDGRNPFSSLVQASNGKLYGMTQNGGIGTHPVGTGVLFSFDPSSSIYTKLVDFIGNNGNSPTGSLIQASNGKLYGMTWEGGPPDGGGGVIFSYDPSSSTFTKLVNLGGIINGGAYPSGSLMQASDGKIYGMTYLGGNNSGSYGAIFSFDPSILTSFDPLPPSYTTLKSFNFFDGARPNGNLVQASNGKLYGMTQFGGSSNVGVIFSFDPVSSHYNKLVDFDGDNGVYPYGSLVQASDGKLYGMTAEGGSSGRGVIFSLNPQTSNYTKLVDFDNTNGAYPLGNLFQASDGKLYGMTNGGGSNNLGVIFSFDPSSSTYTKLRDLDGSNAAHPHLGAAFIELRPDVALPLHLLSFTGALQNNAVKLSWQTTNEINTKDFIVERSNDGINFSAIGKVDAEISPAINHNYNYTDNAPVTGNNFYRLKMEDKDGSSTYSHIVKINYNKRDGIGITVAPNPVFNSTSVSFTIPQPQHVSLKIFDANGKMIKILVDTKFEKGQYKVKWNTEEVSGGIYFLQFVSGTYSETKEISVIK